MHRRTYSMTDAFGTFMEREQGTFCISPVLTSKYTLSLPMPSILPISLTPTISGYSTNIVLYALTFISPFGMIILLFLQLLCVSDIQFSRCLQENNTLIFSIIRINSLFFPIIHPSIRYVVNRFFKN